jgi:dihydrolipoamide dehydrogenase
VKLILANRTANCGAHIIGAEATELIAELGPAITLEATHEENGHHPRASHPERIRHEASGVASDMR